MINVEEYKNLLKALKILQKTLNNTKIEKVYGFHHKPGHLKEHYHWNPVNLNNKLNDKKKVSMNEVSPWAQKSGKHKIRQPKSRKFFYLPLIHMQFNETQDL